MDPGVSQLAIECQHISNVTKELEFLSLLFTHATSYNSMEFNNLNSNVPETSGMKTFFKILSRICRDCGGIWTVNEDLDWLVFYLFARCYGWSDIDLNDVRSQMLAPSTGHRYRNVSKDEELRMKDKVIQITTELIYLIRSLPLSLAGLKMLISSMNLARGMHHTRKQIALHAIDWLTFGLQTDGGGVKATTSPRFTQKISTTQPFLPEDSTPESMFMTVKDLIWNCCTDNNRSIRMGTLGPLYILFGQLSTNTIIRLIKLSVEILEKPEVCASEVTEGVIDILNVLLRRLVPSEQLCNSRTSLSGNTLMSKTNLSAYKFSAEYVQNQLFPRLSKMIANLFQSNHFNVRKAAVRVYLTCLSRCPNETFKEVLLQTVNDLCMNADKQSESYQDKSPSNFESWKSNPYFNESLLTLCRSLIKKAGETNLPSNTGDLQNCLVNFYLGHSSQYVRNSACSLYLTLFISASKNPNRIRYLLNKILEKWQVKQDVVLSPLSKLLIQINETETTTPREMPLTVSSKLSWTWREGRMRMYYLVARSLVGLHLKALHELDADGYSTMNSEDFCISPTFTDDCSQRTLYTSSNNNLHQFGFGPLPKSIPPALVSNPDRQAPVNKSSTLSQPVETSPTLFQQGAKLSSPQTSIYLTVLENIRMLDNERNGKQTDSKTQSWIKRLSIVSGLTSTSKTNVGHSELNSISMKSMLFNILRLAVECTLDENNGLRHSAQKAINDVGRLIRWYDADLLLEMISLHMIGPPTMMSYATLKILRDGLSELCMYDEILQKEEEEPGFTEKYAISGTVPILNVALLYGLFSPDRSRLWLQCCQQYILDSTMALFISTLSIECALRTLCLVHRLSNLSLVACTWENMRPNPFSNLPYAQRKLDLDAKDVVECIKGVVEFAQRIDVKLGPTNEPILNVVNFHKMMITQKPYLSCLQLPQSTAKCSLTYFVLKLVTKLESVIYSYIPPSVNSSRPNPDVRMTGGLLLSPILPYLITWPLALLPPSLDKTLGNPSKEARILAVRKLLRIIAAIILALPITNKTEFSKSESSTIKGNALLKELASIAEHSVELETVVSACFAQLENLVSQLNQYYEPTRICTTTSWWWIRALCEHLPRFMQVAPFSNPVNILRLLIQDVKKKSILSTNTKQNTGHQTAEPTKWSRALEYGLQEAKSKIRVKEGSGALKYQWPKVGEILQAKETIEKQYILESKSGKKSPTRSLSSHIIDTAPSPIDEEQHRFFVTSDNEEEEVCILQEEVDTSSPSDNDDEDEEEQEQEIKDNLLHKQEKVSSLFYIPIKAEPIETPPAIEDVHELIERVLQYCRPDIVTAVRQILSDFGSPNNSSLEKSIRIQESVLGHTKAPVIQ
ncbi:unnamed protein product [Schistosoma margrebowiei]|uniref:Uncharacterized protein n=1 Tax=Schistosoma margrebowiei TaxID=48269 RepID=A0AA85ANM5_9TREM|nr:unnamed protein product [Schistosoma margrebowiei]